MAVETALQLSAWMDEEQNRSVHQEFIAALFDSLHIIVLKISQIQSKLKRKTCGGLFTNCKCHLSLQHNGTAFFLMQQQSNQLQHSINMLQWYVSKNKIPNLPSWLGNLQPQSSNLALKKLMLYSMQLDMFARN